MAPQPPTYEPHRNFDQDSTLGRHERSVGMFSSLVNWWQGGDKTSPGDELRLIGTRQQSMSQTLVQQGRDKAFAESMSAAVRADQNEAMRTLQGFYALGKKDFSQDRSWYEGIYGKAADTAGSWMLNQTARSGFDSLVGGRSRAPLLEALYTSGRSGYDPATGAHGMSIASAERISGQLHKELFSGPGREATSGFTSSETGELLKDMMLRGQLGGATSRNMGGGAVDLEKAAEFDGKRIAAALKSKTRSVKAMQEIFGDEGMPNAPMKMLVEALESFAGGVQQLGDAKAEMTVRTLRQSAKQAGLKLSDLNVLMAQAGGTAQALGLNQAFAPQMVTSGLNTLSAIQNSGALANPMWGLASAEEIAMQTQQQTAQGIGSKIGNRLGLVFRLQSQGLLKGGDLDTVLNNAKAGKHTDATAAFANMSDEEFLTKTASQTGLSVSELRSNIRMTQRNMEHLHKSGTAGFLHTMQREDIEKFLQREGYDEAAAGLVTRAGVTGEARARLMRDLSQTGSRALMDMGHSIRSNEKTRQAVGAAFLEQKLGSSAEGRQMLKSLAGEEGGVTGALGRFFEQGFGLAEAINPNLPNDLLGRDPSIAADKAKKQTKAETAAFVNAMLAGEGVSSDMFTRTMDVIRKAGDGKNLGLKEGLKILGFESTEKIAKESEAAFNKLLPVYEQLQQAEGKALTPYDSSKETPEQFKTRAKSHEDAIAEKRKALEEELVKMGATWRDDEQIQAYKDQHSTGEGGEGGSGISMEGANFILNFEKLELNGEVVSGKTKGKPTGGGRGSTGS